MRIVFLSLFVFAACLSGNAQQTKQDVISPGGGYSRSSLGSLEWTIGETVASTYVSDREIYTQGFNQSFFVVGKRGDDYTGNELVKILAAPNPVTSTLTLSIEVLAPMSYSVAITDLRGVKVYQKYPNSSSQNLNIDMRRFANGVYLVQVFDKNNNVVNTSKVVKL